MNFPCGAAEMPAYRSHKRVNALKITKLDFHDNGADLLADGFDPWTVDAEYVRINPKLSVGGYYVVYEDGYRSYSPARAFEDGYTRI